MLNAFSFGQPEVEPMPDDCNPYPNMGGVYLFFDYNMNVLAVYSANDFHTSLRGMLKAKRIQQETGFSKVKGGIPNQLMSLL